jgi:hypothetical protein
MSNVVDNDKQVAKELTLAVAAKMITTFKDGAVDFEKLSNDIAKAYSIIYQTVKKT